MASEVATTRQTVVGDGLEKYSTRGSLTALGSLSQLVKMTRRNSAPMGKVLSEAMMSSICGSLAISRSSRLNSAMPVFSRRERIRSTACELLSSSDPTIR